MQACSRQPNPAGRRRRRIGRPDRAPSRRCLLCSLAQARWPTASHTSNRALVVWVWHAKQVRPFIRQEEPTSHSQNRPRSPKHAPDKCSEPPAGDARPVALCRAPEIDRDFSSFLSSKSSAAELLPPSQGAVRQENNVSSLVRRPQTEELPSCAQTLSSTARG